MRINLIVVLITAAFLQVNATSFAQKISISASNVSIEKVFREIRKQSGYDFFYDSDIVKKSNPVSIHLKDATIEQALESCFAGQPLVYTLDNKAVVVRNKKNTAGDFIPPITVKGKVLDDSGQPLPGASVKVKASGRSTFTNAQGEFQLSGVDNDAVLVISFIGFGSQEVSVNSRTSITVTLKPDQLNLENVVVVGYGTQKKVNLTGAVSVIDSKKIEDRPVTNVLGALQGAASGITVTRTSGQPGSEGYNMQIRGLSSVNGGNPLYIVDGAPGSITTLNPNDIASISVLKDAAAAAIYGARAAGGVVLITTKNGKSGKPTIQYTGMYGEQKMGRMPERLHSYEEADLVNVAFVNSGFNKPYSDEYIGWLKDPDYNYRVNPNNPNIYDYYYDVNPIKEIVKVNTPSQQHNLALSGGNATNKYLLSLGYYNQEGMFRIDNDKTERINARINYNTKFTNKFSADLRLSYINTNTLSPSRGTDGDYNLLYNLYKIRTIYPVYLPESNDTKYATGNDAFALLKDGGKSESTNHYVNPVISFKADSLVRGLSLRAIYAPSLVFNNQESISRSVEMWDRLRINKVQNSPNSYSDANMFQIQNSIQMLADYDFKIKQANNFHVLLGSSFEDYNYRRTVANARGLSSNDLFNIGLGDPKLATNSQNIQTWALLSYFARVNYNFNDKYLLEVNTRYDGSSKLAPGNRWQLFPSFSAAWRINNEDWFKNNISFFDELKIRGSWGQLGNSDGVIGNYDYIALINKGSVYPFNNQINDSFYQNNLASPDKTWETIESSNIGLDAQILKGRLGFSGDYYVKRNKNMLAPLQVSSTIGVNPSTYNVADLKTWGWELNVNWKDRVGSQFNYYVNANLSDDQNKILNYNGQSTVGSGVNRIIEGMPYNAIYGFQADGYFQNASELVGAAFQNNKTGVGDIRYKDLDGNKVISAGLGRLDNHGDLTYLGSTQPRYSFGFDFGFDFKGIDFAAFFQGVGKRNALLDPYAILPLLESWRLPWKENLDYWTPENPNARYPRMVYAGTQNGVNSTHWLANSAYLRLKNIQLGYTLPSSLASKVKADKVRIYFSGQDLWETTKMWHPYYDPEAPSGANYLYPFFRNYTLGLNVNF